MCTPYATADGGEERYEGIWAFEWAPPDLPAPPAGEYGYIWYRSRVVDPTLGTVPRIGDDACYRSAGAEYSRWSVDSDGTLTDTGSREDMGFVFAFRTAEAPTLPPHLHGLNE